MNNENVIKKGGDDEEEDDSQDRLQDIGDSTSFHDRDGDVPVSKTCLQQSAGTSV